MYAVVKLEHWSRADAFVLALDGSDFGGLQLRVEKVSSRFTGAGFCTSIENSGTARVAHAGQLRPSAATAAS